MHKIRSFFLGLALSIITAAIVFGQSKITITSELGPMYGDNLFWMVVAVAFFTAVYANMATRIGLVANNSLWVTIRQQQRKWAPSLIGFGIFSVGTSFQAGNSNDVGLSIGVATATFLAPWVIMFNLVGISLFFFRNSYRVLERLMTAIATTKSVTIFFNPFIAMVMCLIDSNKKFMKEYVAPAFHTDFGLVWTSSACGTGRV